MSSFNSQSSGIRPVATMERPTTAASSNRKLIDLENELKNEKKSSKKLSDEVDALKKEIHKQNFSSFT
jgi:predicted  nucleic acid-binding Zn-ribbon protein